MCRVVHSIDDRSIDQPRIPRFGIVPSPPNTANAPVAQVERVPVGVVLRRGLQRHQRGRVSRDDRKPRIGPPPVGEDGRHGSGPKGRAW